MRNAISLGLLVATAAITPFGVKAAPMSKCVANGAVTYQQGPCPSTQPRKEPTLDELNAAERNRRAAATPVAAPPTSRQATSAPPPAPTAAASFSCDGRRYCSQMKSCEEAKYFLANCPGVKMDGDRNGTPCEKQWCIR